MRSRMNVTQIETYCWRIPSGCSIDHTLDPRRHTINVNDGEAILTDIEALGTFTVGVTLESPGVQLEIDLSKLPGTGTEFRGR